MPLSKILSAAENVRNSHADGCQTRVATFCEWNEDGDLTVKNTHRICINHERDFVLKLACRCEDLCLVMHIYVLIL